MKNAGAMVTGPVGPTLAKGTLVMLGGMASLVAFNLIDTWYVALLGTEELAAIGFTFPVVMGVGAVARGLGVGAMAVLSPAAGAGRREEARHLSTDALWFSMAIVLVVIGVGLVTLEPIFLAMGATPELMPLIRAYMVPWYLGVPFLVVPMVGNGLLRAVGEIRVSSWVMIVAMLVNAVLDPLLIFGWGPVPAMGMAGAAWATVAARAMSMAVGLWVLAVREHLVEGTLPPLARWWRNSRAVWAVGAPAVLHQWVMPLSAALVTLLLARHGAGAVAAVGAASKVEMAAFTVLMSLGTVLGPFVGQNAGAGRWERVRQGVQMSMRFSLLWGGAVALALFALSEPVARAFSDDPAVVDWMVHYLWLVPISFGLSGSMHMAAAAFQVLGRAWAAFGMNLFRVVLMVPVAFFLDALFPVEGVFAGMSLAGALVGLGAWAWLDRTLANAARAAGTTTG